MSKQPRCCSRAGLRPPRVAPGPGPTSPLARADTSGPHSTCRHPVHRESHHAHRTPARAVRPARASSRKLAGRERPRARPWRPEAAT
eukprot:7378988-Prymnesium_polylepis.1